jgi:hypothetical protein
MGNILIVVMIVLLVVGIVTRDKVVSTVALVITGGSWILGSLCLTVASLEEDDDWKEISSNLWGSFTGLFASGSGLVFGKWMAMHK